MSSREFKWSEDHQTNKVIRTAYSICENLKKSVHVNMNILQCKEIIRNEDHGLMTIVTRTKSQVRNPHWYLES